jgi:hypothetical protein
MLHGGLNTYSRLPQAPMVAIRGWPDHCLRAEVTAVDSAAFGFDLIHCETTDRGRGTAATEEQSMSNPWMKKNPFMSMWLSGANSIANTARGRIAAEARRQSSTAITKATSDMFGAWPGFTTAATRKRKKNRFPGV